MNSIKIENRTLFHLSIVLIVAVIVTLFSMSLSFLDTFTHFFGRLSRLPLAEFFINIVFLLLIGLLWFTYRRWRVAAMKKKELEDVIDSISPDVLMEVDPDRNIIRCNPSVKRVFGYEVHEIIHRETDFLYLERHEIDDPLVKAGFQVGWATGTKKNGDTIHLEIVTGTLHHRGGAVLLLRDITEQNRMEEELEKARGKEIETERLKAVTEMAVSLSHEINNPLCIISGIAQLTLMHAEKLDAEIADQFEKISEQSKRIEAVTHKLTEIRSVITTPYVGEYGMIDIEKSTKPEYEA